jgi:hypothetical protein
LLTLLHDNRNGTIINSSAGNNAKLAGRRNIMNKLTREQAVVEVGSMFVDQVEAAPCDFSNRCTNDGTVEFVATVKAGKDEDGFSRTISAYYFQDGDDVDAVTDLDGLSWNVGYYTVQ